MSNKTWIIRREMKTCTITEGRWTFLVIYICHKNDETNKNTIKNIHCYLNEFCINSNLIKYWKKTFCSSIYDMKLLSLSSSHILTLREGWTGRERSSYWVQTLRWSDWLLDSGHSQLAAGLGETALTSTRSSPREKTLAPPRCQWWYPTYNYFD